MNWILPIALSLAYWIAIYLTFGAYSWGQLGGALIAHACAYTAGYCGK